MGLIKNGINNEEPTTITFKEISEYISILEDCDISQAYVFSEKYGLFDETSFKYNQRAKSISVIEFKRALKIAIARANNAGKYPETPPDQLPYDGYDLLELPNITTTLTSGRNPHKIPADQLPKEIACNQSADIPKRAETTYLNIIAAMLETLLSGRTFKSQNELTAYLSSHYNGYDGMGESTLRQKFSMARKNLDQSS